MPESSILWKHYQTPCFDVPTSIDFSSFGIITASNPESIAHTDAQNNERNAQLEHYISECGWEYVSLTAGSPDMLWQESSFAVKANRSDLFAVSETWQQNAFYWVNNKNLILVPVLLAPHFQPVNLGHFDNRLTF
ncbi:DUF3293 domain-containing protein [Veronia nyctiphanis]|nr:DUF3293 domain-containing protein [Veronia nyctiphanis]